MNTLHQPTVLTPDALHQAALRLKKLNNLRPRDIAEQLQVSECEIVSSRCGLTHDELGSVKRLQCTPTSRKAMFEQFPKLGKIMSMTRNDSAVHERKGIFESVRVGEQMGLILGNDIDLRLIFKNWAYAFSVTDVSETRTLNSIQFFDPYGQAVYKLYAVDQTNMDEWHTLIQKFLDEHQDAGEEVLPLDEEADEPKTSNSSFDVAQFQNDWQQLTDVHQFHPMLKRHGISRIDAMNHAPQGSVTEVRVDCALELLNRAQAQTLPIMIFVGNRGCVQIHTGPIERIVQAKGWLNILDPDFNLHLKENHLHSAWVVRRPSTEGVITCIDFFDAQNNLIMSTFGKRIPLEPEMPEWQALAESLASDFAKIGQVA